MSLLAETIKDFKLRLFVYCLMNNHFHLYLQTADANLDQAMRNLFTHFVKYINFRHERVGPLFQGRYKARLVDSNVYSQTLSRYIHQNPKEAGLVEKLEDYPWSSYPCYTGKLPKWDWLETEWLLSQFHSHRPAALEGFIEFHQEKIPDLEFESLRHWGNCLGIQTQTVPGTQVPGTV